MAKQIKYTKAGVANILPSGSDYSKTTDYFKDVMHSPTVNPDHAPTTDYFKDVMHSPDAPEDHGEYNPPTAPNTGNGGRGGAGGGNAGGSVGVVGTVGTGNDISSRMNSQFQVSQNYLDAMKYTQSLLDKINTGRTSYTDQLNALMDQISNREKFSYDMSKDTLFQNYLSEMMGSGQTAMRDTIGQASALTGGYGSSYATTAGNQAYNSMIQDAYSNLPDYYNMALSVYNAEGDQLMNQFGMLSQADATEYGRLMDAYNANYNQAQNLYGQEYQRWSDDVQNAFNLAKFAEEQRQFNAEMGYKYSSLNQSNEHWKAEMDYQKQKDADTAKAKATADAKASILAQNQASADAKKAEEKARQEADDAKYANYSDQQISSIKQNAIKKFNTGGEKAYAEYLQSLGNLREELAGEIDAYVQEFGNSPLNTRSWTMIDSKTYQDEYGKRYTKDQLKGDPIWSLIKKLKQGQTYNPYQ